ncbi:asparagine synthase-related protein [Aquimarina sp. 2201CG1-2-11]|uniref:asparagine synthase-related protein n=1 Tax=Aquimarina discodermiae TaxID=3231043 RepID=UPI0034636F24
MNYFILSKKDIAPSGGEHQIYLLHDWVITLQTDDYKDCNKEGVRIIIIGDYIGSVQTLFDTEHSNIPKLRGNFYAIVVSDQTIKIYNSFLSILPLYFTNDHRYISSSIRYIRNVSQEEFSINKKYILEGLLFNYGFFNRTLYKEIQLLSSNSFLILNEDSVNEEKHFETTSLFHKNPSRGSKVVDQLSDLFISTTAHYFPDTSFTVAFTSGFDGRTLVSCATHFQKDIKTFSFGKPENDDVAIPKLNAEELNIPYQSLDLGSEAYIREDYLNSAKDYIDQFPGANGLIYPHIAYSAKQIAKDSEFLLSGVIGSELFRALHITGAVTSQALVDIFTSNSTQEIRDKITNSKALEAIKKEEFHVELEELIEEIIAYRTSISKDLTQNQQFYVFVFEEVFRKFFGQWIAMQMHHIKVRTPFLDYIFIKELLKTQYAGVNNDFFTENPLKRMKGQYLYTDIIKKTNKRIYQQMTGKGYRPKDLRESIYIYKIIFPFITKRLRRKIKTPYLDNLGIISGILANKEHVKKLINNTTYFDSSKLLLILDTLTPTTPEKERDTLLMMMSVLIALRHNPIHNKTKQPTIL